MNLAKYFRSFKTLRGGLHLPEDVYDVGHRDFRPLPGAPPERLFVPIADSAGDDGLVLVTVGARVDAGEPIARSADGTYTHAPMSGTVSVVSRVSTPHVGEVPAIEIATDDASEPPPAELLEGQVGDVPESRAAFVAMMREAGVRVGGLAHWVDGEHPKAVIVCGLDAAPPQTCRTQMLFRYGATVIETASLIHKLFGARRTYLAVDRAHRSLVRVCEDRSHHMPVRVAALDNKFPQAADALLVRTILNRSLAPGQAPSAVGAVVLGVADLVDMARALRGEPVTHRLISIAGDEVGEPGNYRVPIGMPILEVAAAVGARDADARVVVNCLLSGPAIADARTVVTKRTSAIFAVTPANDARPVPCIRCGNCQDACPVELDPFALHQTAEHGQVSRVPALHPDACLACGLCDYVCPSELPLMRSVLAAKELRREG